MGSDVVPQVTLQRPVDPTSVTDRTLLLLDSDLDRVAGRIETDQNVLRFHPSAALADDEYTLMFESTVLAIDGSTMTLPGAPIAFSVHARVSTWSNPPIELGAAGDGAPVVATDRVGGAALAWVHDGQISVAEYDRDFGWRYAAVVDRNAGSVPPTLYLARGAGAIVLAAVIPDPFSSSLSLIRLWMSDRQLSGGIRVWQALSTISADVTGSLVPFVTSTGEVALLLASRAQAISALRLHWLNSPTRGIDHVSGPGQRFDVDALYLGALGDLAVAWTATDGSVRGSYVRQLRGALWESAHALPGTPSDGGIDADGNLWLLVPVSPSQAAYVAQDDHEWRLDTPILPVGLTVRRDRSGRLLVLDWHADAGGERLLTQTHDRAGHFVSEQVVVGPTPEPIVYDALMGDVDAEMTLVWQQGQTTMQATYDAASARFAAPAPWQRRFLPVPIERATLTPAGPRTWITWVEGDRLVATHTTPRAWMPRPRPNPRASSSPTPLRDEILVGASNGALLVVWNEGGKLLAQDVRD